MNSSPYANRKASTLAFSGAKGESGSNLDGESMIKAQGTTGKERLTELHSIYSELSTRYFNNDRAIAIASSRGSMGVFPDLDAPLSTGKHVDLPISLGSASLTQFWTSCKSLIDEKKCSECNLAQNVNPLMLKMEICRS